jgi:Txe/YoeB family toxin of toxin-antitoxin system
LIAAVVVWELRFSGRAQKDKIRLEEANLWPGVLEMLKAIQRNPWTTPPPCEKLKGDLAGLVSRRISYTHRLVYEVDREARIVKILSMWTHYE